MGPFGFSFLGISLPPTPLTPGTPFSRVLGLLRGSPDPYWFSGLSPVPLEEALQPAYAGQFDIEENEIEIYLFEADPVTCPLPIRHFTSDSGPQEGRADLAEAPMWQKADRGFLMT